LQNRAIFNANMQCFPKMKAHIEQWKKMHSEM